MIVYVIIGMLIWWLGGSLLVIRSELLQHDITISDMILTFTFWWIVFPMILWENSNISKKIVLYKKEL